jgi:hypothetical protein
VVGQFYRYGINPDGSQWTEVRQGSPNSPAFERTTTDMLGRTVSVERPAFGGGIERTESVYDAFGRLAKQVSSGSAPLLYEYDELNQVRRTGLDVDGNGQLDSAANDRVQESETRYVDRGGVWQETTQRLYAQQLSTTPVTVSVQRSRLGGLRGRVIAAWASFEKQGSP